MLSVIVISILMMASLLTWGFITLRWSLGQPALEALPQNRSPLLPIACGAAAIYVAIMLVLSLNALINRPEATPTVDVESVRDATSSGLLEALVALALLTGGGRVPLRECGLYLNDLARQMVDGVGGFAASLIPVFAILLLTFALRTPDNQHPFLKLLQDDRSFATTGWLLISAVIVAPIKEELIFRVMLQDGLARRIGSASAIGVVSLLFCAVHGFPDSIALLPLAVILGYVYDRRQSVLSVIIIHALFNLTNISILLLEPPELPS